MALHDVSDAGRFYHLLADAHLIAISQPLNARGDVHVLSEIIDPIIERHRDRPALVDAYLQDQRL